MLSKSLRCLGLTVSVLALQNNVYSQERDEDEALLLGRLPQSHRTYGADREELSIDEQQKLLKKIHKKRKRQREHPTGMAYAMTLDKDDLEAYARSRWGADGEDDEVLDFSKPTPPLASKLLTTKGPFFDHMTTDLFSWLEDKSFFTQNKQDRGPNYKAILKLIASERTFADFDIKIAESERVIGLFMAFQPHADQVCPSRFGAFMYYSRQHAEGVRYYRYHIQNKVEELLIDEGKLSKNNTCCELSDFSVDDHDRLLGYSIDTNGSEIYTIHFLNTQTKEKLLDVLEQTAPSLQFNQAGTGAIYCQLNESHRKTHLRFHTIGTSQDQDATLWNETRPGFFITFDISPDRQYLVGYSGNGQEEDTWFYALSGEGPQSVQKFIDAEDGFNNTLSKINAPWIYTSYQNQLFRTALSAGRFDHTQGPFLKAEPHRHLKNFELYQNHVAVLFMKDVLPFIEVYQAQDVNQHYAIRFNEPVSNLSFNFTTVDDPYLRLRYSSPLTPACEMECHFNTGVVLKRQQDRVSNFKAADYHTERRWVESVEGVRVPMDLFYKKSVNLRKSPLLVTAYGAYGEMTLSDYDAFCNVLVDQGFVLATICPRGGGELGESWHQAGSGLHKKNTFLDVVACIQALHKGGVSKPTRTVFNGESAGGLIAGFIANEHPDLVRAVFMHHPFLDALGGGMNLDIPSTQEQWKEWGNPLESKDVFESMKSWCPYENIKFQRYPHVIVTGGQSDVRTPYWEALKWAQKVRQTRVDDGLTYCYIDPQGGHRNESDDVAMSSDIYRLCMLLKLFTQFFDDNQ